MQLEKQYEKIARKHSLPTHKMRNAIIAFVCGGILAILAQLSFEIIKDVFSLDKETATSFVVILIIAFAALLTGLGVYDKLAQFYGAGLFVPISGFANSLASCALEGKSEGLIYGIGSNMFKLAGSVITYGIVSVYIIGIVRYVVGV